jgi:hypothetical protein
MTIARFLRLEKAAKVNKPVLLCGQELHPPSLAQPLRPNGANSGSMY